MDKVQTVNQRLADIGIDMAGQTAQPGLYGIDPLGDDSKTQPRQHPFDSGQFIVRGLRVIVPNGDGVGQVAPLTHRLRSIRRNRIQRQ
ncbi:hypothetical protein [Niveispirillum sp.]|uniref:hypothetical protein n=1 Tax=Niveispirillum sp. TaxID=1917217 RepID=UPI00345DD556